MWNSIQHKQTVNSKVRQHVASLQNKKTKLRVFVNEFCLNGVFDSFVGCISLYVKCLRNVARYGKFPKESDR